MVILCLIYFLYHDLVNIIHFVVVYLLDFFRFRLIWKVLIAEVFGLKMNQFLSLCWVSDACLLSINADLLLKLFRKCLARYLFLLWEKSRQICVPFKLTLPYFNMYLQAVASWLSISSSQFGIFPREKSMFGNFTKK